MYLRNFRKGFATNSSSLHSIFITDSELLNDHYPDTKCQFGWDSFMLSSKYAKQLYFAVNLYSQFPDNQKDKAMKHINKHWPNISEEELKEGYIDHQSLIIVPKFMDSNSYRSHFAVDFYFNLIQHIIDDNYVICGGNDNDYQENLYTVEITNNNSIFYSNNIIDRLKDSKEDDWFIRKESFGWTLFHKLTGDKYSLSENNKEIDYTNYMPELVDLKITNYCKNNCNFCYQGSSEKGKHADAVDIYKIIDFLHNSNVFEIVLGGGEPFTHPNLFSIIDRCNDRNISCSLTTKAHDLCIYPGFFDALCSKISQLGISVTNLNEVEFIHNKLKDIDPRSIRKITFQVILEIISKNELYNIAKFCNDNNYRLLILGFKEPKTEIFTDSIIKLEYDWLEPIIQLQHLYFGIDNVIVNTYKNLLNKHNISKLSYFSEEGIKSKYIDCINWTINDSSYSKNEPKKLPIELYGKTLLTI